MAETQPQISILKLKQYARIARNAYGDSTAVVGKCDYICYHLQDELHVEEGIPREAVSVEEQRIGPDGEENHYICIISPDYIKDADGPVWVDMSLDQFCNYNVEAELVSVSLGEFDTIERIRVMPPGDSRRTVYQSASEWLKTQLSDL